MSPTHPGGVEKNLGDASSSVLGFDDLVDDTDVEGSTDAAGDHLMLRGKFEF